MQRHGGEVKGQGDVPRVKLVVQNFNLLSNDLQQPFVPEACAPDREVVAFVVLQQHARQSGHHNSDIINDQGSLLW